MTNITVGCWWKTNYFFLYRWQQLISSKKEKNDLYKISQYVFIFTSCSWLACIVSIWYNCICVMVTLKVSPLCVLRSIHYNWPKGQAMCTVISFYTLICLLKDYWRRVLYFYLYDKILINYLEHLKIYILSHSCDHQNKGK